MRKRPTDRISRRLRKWALPAIALTVLSASVGVVRATPAGAAAGTIAATPNARLYDGQTITVNGSGWLPGHEILVIQCHPDALSVCDLAAPRVIVDANGHFTRSLVVERQLATVDCADPNITFKCEVIAIDVSEPFLVVTNAPLSFTRDTVVLPGGAVVAEGDSSTTDLLVPLRLSSPSTQTVTVEWRTASVSGPPPHADPATDFTVASGVVTFAPGETAKTVTVSVNGDTLVEPDDWIVLSFRHPTNARMGGFWGLGFGVILNDD